MVQRRIHWIALIVATSTCLTLVTFLGLARTPLEGAGLPGTQLLPVGLPAATAVPEANTCLVDKNTNDRVDVPDIMENTRKGTCQGYLSSLAGRWRQPWANFGGSYTFQDSHHGFTPPAYTDLESRGIPAVNLDVIGQGDEVLILVNLAGFIPPLSFQYYSLSYRCLGLL